VDDGLTPASRFIRGLLYRLAFVPLLIALAVSGMIYAGSHPFPPPSDLDPTCQGIYYDAATLVTDDGVRLDAWLVPVVDATLVLSQKEEVLRHKQPAVVLVHDFGNRRQQMLPLVRPLHQAGFVVLVIGLRGGSGAGSTFGLREALDIKAGVEMLRRRPFVDPARIAVVGIGSGASAALLAAKDDPTLAALVLDHPARDASAVVEQHLVPHHPALAWMSPLCKWGFEIAYRVDADDLNLSRFSSVMHSRPVLLLDLPSQGISSGTAVVAVRDFLKAGLHVTPQTASAR
jgi:acetyl esterase/lipase